MPSVQARQENNSSESFNDVSVKTILYIKRKIKYYEQRKQNLLDIQQRIDAGNKDKLEREQIHAVSKLPEVDACMALLEPILQRVIASQTEIQTLERSRKQQLKVERTLFEHQRLQRTFLIQNVLEVVACHTAALLLDERCSKYDVTQANLDKLNELRALIVPSRFVSRDFKEQLVQCSEHMSRLLSRSQKKVLGTTYEHLVTLIDKLCASGILDNLGTLVETAGLAANHFAGSTAPAAPPSKVDSASHAQYATTAQIDAAGEPNLFMASGITSEGAHLVPAVNGAATAGCVAETLGPLETAGQTQAPHDKPAIKFLQASELSTGVPRDMAGLSLSEGPEEEEEEAGYDSGRMLQSYTYTNTALTALHTDTAHTVGWGAPVDFSAPQPEAVYTPHQPAASGQDSLSEIGQWSDVQYVEEGAHVHVSSGPRTDYHSEQTQAHFYRASRGQPAANSGYHGNDAHRNSRQAAAANTVSGEQPIDTNVDDTGYTTVTHSRNNMYNRSGPNRSRDYPSNQRGGFNQQARDGQSGNQMGHRPGYQARGGGPRGGGRSAGGPRRGRYQGSSRGGFRGAA